MGNAEVGPHVFGHFKALIFAGTVSVPNLADGIELRREHANQQLFAIARGFFRRAFVPFNAADLVQEPDDSTREPLRIGNAVTAKALPQIACFAYIQNALRFTAQEVNARARGDLAEEIIAEPLDERFRRVEKPELASHASISTRRCLAGNSRTTNGHQSGGTYYSTRVMESRHHQ